MVCATWWSTGSTSTPNIISSTTSPSCAISTWWIPNPLSWSSWSTRVRATSTSTCWWAPSYPDLLEHGLLRHKHKPQAQNESPAICRREFPRRVREPNGEQTRRRHIRRQPGRENDRERGALSLQSRRASVSVEPGELQFVFEEEPSKHTERRRPQIPQQHERLALPQETQPEKSPKWVPPVPLGRYSISLQPRRICILYFGICC